MCFSCRADHFQHARRVLSLLQLDSIVEGIVYCDYANPELYVDLRAVQITSSSCKPEPEFFLAAQEGVRASPNIRHYFVDDSLANIKQALRLGWQDSGTC